MTWRSLGCGWSRKINFVLGGFPEESLCERIYWATRRRSRTARILRFLIDLFERDHCARAAGRTSKYPTPTLRELPLFVFVAITLRKNP